MTAYRGWWWSPNARRAHYFHGNTVSLCRKLGFVDAELLRREAQDHGDNSPDNCAECKRRVAKLRAREAQEVRS